MTWKSSVKGGGFVPTHSCPSTAWLFAATAPAAAQARDSWACCTGIIRSFIDEEENTNKGNDAAATATVVVAAAAAAAGGVVDDDVDVDVDVEDVEDDNDQRRPFPISHSGIVPGTIRCT